MSKSQKIREYKAANPVASAAEIQTALKKEKITVSMPLIYQVLAKQPKPQRHNGNGGPAVTVASLLEAKKTVAEIGSIEATRKALNLLAKLQS